jgi:hypothetical protein
MPKMLVERKCFSNLLLVFHLLKLGRLMQTMNAWKDFFAFLKVDKLPNMHCSDSNKWGMENCMHNVVLATIKHAIQKGIFPP